MIIDQIANFRHVVAFFYTSGNLYVLPKTDFAALNLVPRGENDELRELPASGKAELLNALFLCPIVGWRLNATFGEKHKYCISTTLLTIYCIYRCLYGLNWTKPFTPAGAIVICIRMEMGCAKITLNLCVDLCPEFKFLGVFLWARSREKPTQIISLVYRM